MKRQLLCVVLFLGMLFGHVVMAQEIPATDPPQSVKYQLIRFGAPWCGPCKLYDKVVADTKLQEYCDSLGVTYHYYDIDKEKAFFDSSRLQSIPAWLLVEELPNNLLRIHKRWGGRGESLPFMTVEELLQFANPFTNGPDITPTASVHIPEASPQYQPPLPVQRYPYNNRWTVDGGIGNIDNHLRGWPHNVDSSGMSFDQKLQYHDREHDRIGPISGQQIRYMNSRQRPCVGSS